MNGMDRTTGKPIGGLAYLRQRLADVLATPVGTRVMRRAYGSRLFDLTDQPMTPRWLVQVYAATYEALANPVNGLPDFRPMRVSARRYGDGHGEVDLYGVYVPTGQLVKVEGIRI